MQKQMSKESTLLDLKICLMFENIECVKRIRKDIEKKEKNNLTRVDQVV